MLARQIECESLPERASVLDLCTGSGILAIAAAQHAAVSMVTAVDVSPAAVAAARLNGLLNGVRIRSMRGDLFGPVAGQRFDMIVSNPPYLPMVDASLPVHGLARAWEGGVDGRSVIDRICAQAGQHLHPGGVVLLVHSSVCGESATLAAFARHNLHARVLCRHRGPLGPLMRGRAAALHERGLLPDTESEELIVIGARQDGDSG
jgi:release factor glutamine methyltransferase